MLARIAAQMFLGGTVCQKWISSWSKAAFLFNRTVRMLKMPSGIVLLKWFLFSSKFLSCNPTEDFSAHFLVIS
ncbi:hypothetical protein H6P81_011844 [Aristolochia fimbriata]|uniref:Uncharacterized protein n=1 Tax=Aristolochia fimbriata TaxID=158543 RepID=A0AAV7EBE0_ARIFI|nr:hypothetical protein H6P81_011844 [Aristolochia fimbriata]